ncbi:MAG TPA: sensor histidine kinase [Pseudogracilibacillus sp.]|nr:sensor histidine kinase [Pseudogracilibacillus sp.]
MKHKLSSLRFMTIYAQLYALFLIFLTLATSLFFVYAVFDPSWLTIEAIFFMLGLYAFLSLLVTIIVSFRQSGLLISRLQSLSVLITQYANGNYLAEVHDYTGQKDELYRIFIEMNELGDVLDKQVKSLSKLAEKNASLAKQSHKSAVIEERQRLARDLHDSVSQQLFALTMLAEASIKQLDSNPQLAKEQMTDVIQSAHETQAEMRALLLHLRPVYLSGDSLTDGIRRLVKEIEERNDVSFVLNLAEITVSEVIEEHLFRIIQEALSNILRHAKAEEGKITLQDEDTHLFVHISDNGQGFEENEGGELKTSFGLKTMRERAEELGGKLTIRSAQEKGTYIDIKIPKIK